MRRKAMEKKSLILSGSPHKGGMATNKNEAE